ETALDTARRWAEQASDNGYILAAPAWGTGNGDVYGYSSEEHMTVLDVLRDLRKRFNVDSDRVFLTGWGQGGNMAYDVGLAHPDLFAGVVPISAAPNVYGTHYKTNAQLLPFYVVIGDRSGALQNQNREQYKYWVASNYPSLFIEYKGRGVEFFAGEVPYL